MLREVPIADQQARWVEEKEKRTTMDPATAIADAGQNSQSIVGAYAYALRFSTTPNPSSGINVIRRNSIPQEG
jgi:hypothetical protein